MNTGSMRMLLKAASDAAQHLLRACLAAHLNAIG
jgi:hypothetical protein